MMHRDFAEELSSLRLGLQQVVLISHSRAVARISRLLNLLEQLSVAFEDLQCLGEVGELKISRLDTSGHRTARGFILLQHHVCIALRHLPSEPKFSWVGEIL